ncbi:DUF3558 family protein [Streptomyces sp. NPDC012461]|uniref:DUF3558 family protein n=1 Tax=unclassified Streptomyces TaxID=2593676 RepID=UPI0019618D47|nr:DUF3558 domain-containing protein [Streptomyces sp. S12]
MSEGTMQRRVQRDQRDLGGAPTASRPAARARRLPRVLVAAAAVPVMLVAAGCSSDSGSDGGKDQKASDSSASASAAPSPTVRAAAFKRLPPEACEVLSKKTLDDLVPKAKSGKEGTSDDIERRAGCSWSSLDNNGVKGSQFRWLNVSLLRFESDVARGAGDELAKKYYDKQVGDAQSAEGAKGTESEPVKGAGDEATAVRYQLKKKEGTFAQQTVVVRAENVVVTLDYNGAGLAGEKTPDADGLMKKAQKAAAEAVDSVVEANGKDSPAPDSPAASTSPSKASGKD